MFRMTWRDELECCEPLKIGCKWVPGYGYSHELTTGQLSLSLKEAFLMIRKLVGAGLLALACVLWFPASAHAQSAIAGVVKDTSGAVLPGVTVEAASDVLIEKTRSVVTDGEGA